MNFIHFLFVIFFVVAKDRVGRIAVIFNYLQGSAIVESHGPHIPAESEASLVSPQVLHWRLALYGRERFLRSGFLCLCSRPMLTP